MLPAESVEMSVRALARQLGVSATTVSLALKNSPRVSAGLRARIEKLAKDTGYVPNARLAEVMGEMRRSISPTYHATLGVFSLYPEKEPWTHYPTQYLKDLLDSATACARSHGYQLEYFWLKEPGMRPARLTAILEARGIQGVFCLGCLDPEETFPPELRPFAIVTYGASVLGNLHRVASHFSADAHTLFDELLRRGYTRPGLAILVQGDRRTAYAYSETYLGFLERHLPPPHPAILRSDLWNEADFHRWFCSGLPDVIVLHQTEEYIEGVQRYLRRRGLTVPGKVGIALLDKNPDRRRYSGICQDNPRMGVAAIEMLIGRILLRDFGPSVQPKFELVGGAWNEGRSLRRPDARRRDLRYRRSSPASDSTSHFPGSPLRRLGAE